MQPCHRERRLVLSWALLLGFLVAPLAAEQRQETERRIQSTLERVIDAASSREPETLAMHLACYSGIDAPASLVVRPCVAAEDEPRIEAVAAELRARFDGVSDWVIDWLRTEASTASHAGRPSVHTIQVKLRGSEPPGLVELRFLQHGEEVLLADVGAVRLAVPERPQPGSTRARAERGFEDLLRWTALGADGLEGAAPLMACGDETTRALRPCDFAAASDRERVATLYRRLSRFSSSVVPTGWAFSGYRTTEKSEGTWHLVEVSFREPSSGEDRTFEAGFLAAGDDLLLTDLVGWPE